MPYTDWKLLVVEDDPDGQDFIQRILKHYGISCDAAFSAEESLVRLAQDSYTALIIDLALPQMDGWGLLKAIRNNPQTANLHCFAMTAYHAPEVAMQAIQSGFSAYFPKPLDPSTLVSDIDRVLAG